MPSCHSRRAAAVLLAAGACLLPTAGGCGTRGPQRFRVSGTVTHAGSPVPMGTIVFEPDVMRGNSGPQAFAPIENGRFDTAAPHCKGSVGGPTVVRIDGYSLDPNALDVTTATRQSFPTHEVRIDLPRADTTRDFDVPASTQP